MKTFFIQTFGCQMNVYDGMRIASMLRGLGMVETPNMPDADVIILNTCAVREKASSKVFSALGRIRMNKKPDAIFGIVGCVAREEGANAFRRIPELNFVLGPQSYHKLPDILENPDAKYLNIDLSGLEKFDELPPMTESQTLAYIPIQEGCNHVCTYCIVPYTRGRELSRPFDDVMRDVELAAKNGAVEICFLGQNVNGYRADKTGACPPLLAGGLSQKMTKGVPFESCSPPSPCSATPSPQAARDMRPYFGEHPKEKVYTLADLIRSTARFHAIRRIRFTSSYPTEMTDDLIDLFRTEPKLMPFLNMPIQSGSPNVLRAMNRPYSIEQYMNIIERLRAVRPDIQISSDFIVGFPGETDEDLSQTLDIIKRVGYINSYSFKYSPRPHTAAALMQNQIPENIKKERLKTVDTALTDIMRRFNESCVDKEFDCLVEGGDKTGKHIIARTPYMQQVVITIPSGHPKPAGIIRVRITDANKCSLRGKIID